MTELGKFLDSDFLFPPSHFARNDRAVMVDFLKITTDVSSRAERLVRGGRAAESRDLVFKLGAQKQTQGPSTSLGMTME
jgi:hypothetical protein